MLRLWLIWPDYFISLYVLLKARGREVKQAIHLPLYARFSASNTLGYATHTGL